MTPDVGRIEADLRLRFVTEMYGLLILKWRQGDCIL